MTKREFLDTVFALVPHEANKIMDVFDEYVESNEPHWIPVTEKPIPDGEYLATWSSDIQEKPILSIICRYAGEWDFWELDMLGHRDIKNPCIYATARTIQGGDGMIYHNPLGQAYYRQFVVVTDIDGLMVSGIFDDYDKAVGHVMVNLWEFSESYKEEGDWFKIGEPEYYDEGMHITVKFQSHHWEKPCEETYFILDYDIRKPELDKPKKSKGVTE